ALPRACDNDLPEVEQRVHPAFEQVSGELAIASHDSANLRRERVIVLEELLEERMPNFSVAHEVIPYAPERSYLLRSQRLRGDRCDDAASTITANAAAMNVRISKFWRDT